MSNRKKQHSTKESAKFEQIQRAFATNRGQVERAHERRQITAPAEITIQEPEGSSRTIKAKIGDISAGGFSFNAGSFVHPGTLLTAVLPLPTGPLTLSGIARSCRHVEGSIHRIGVEIIKRDQAKAA